MDNTPRQSKSTQKSTGSKDAKSIKHNKNRDLEAPGLPDLTKEKEIARKASQRLAGRGHGSKREMVVEKVLELVGKGMSFSQISQIAGMPHARTMQNWKKQDPDFAEGVEETFSDYVDDLAKRTVPYMEKIFSLRGLDDSLLDESEKLLPTVKRTADGKQVPVVESDSEWRDGLWKKLNFHILHGEKKARAWSLGAAQIFNNIAAVRVPGWHKDAEAVSNMVVIDMSLEMDKKTDLPGSPTGQNAAALKAMRNVTPRK